MKAFHVILPIALAMLAGCTKNIQTNEAVKQGVVNHLAQNKGLQMASMDLEVTAVTFKDNTAEATVSFACAVGCNCMQMRYTLERRAMPGWSKRLTASATAA